MDPVFLQRAMDILGKVFKCVGFKTNIKKTQVMTCMSGRIWLQLPTNSYHWMCGGYTSAASRDAHTVISQRPKRHNFERNWGKIPLKIAPP